MGFLDDFFGGSKDTGKDDSGKSAGETAKGWFDATATTIAVVAGVYGATHEPTNPSTYVDQAGHYTAIQQEERVNAAFDRPAEAAREAMDGNK